MVFTRTGVTTVAVRACAVHTVVMITSLAGRCGCGIADFLGSTLSTSTILPLILVPMVTIPVQAVLVVTIASGSDVVSVLTTTTGASIMSVVAYCTEVYWVSMRTGTLHGGVVVMSTSTTRRTWVTVRSICCADRNA